MGIPVLILGESGTGKSASLRNFPNDAVAVINVAGKPLPFKNKIQCECTDNYMKIDGHIHALAKQGCKSIVIDDAQYLMANEFMRRATERGFDKFTEIAQNFWSLVNMVKELPGDTIVYFLAHIERDQNGNEKIKTIGKLLDEKITVEGMFTIVLKTNVTDGQYSFITQNSGHDTVKSPMGMFPSMVIDNDLHYVDEKIRNYYELGNFLSDEDMKEIDEAAKKDDIPIGDDGKKKRSRRNAKKEEPENTPEEEKKEAADTTAGEEPVGRRSRSRKSREQVMEENAGRVANANTSEDGEPIDFKESETEDPEIEKVPRRTRKDRSAEEAAMNAPEEPKEEAEEQAAPRRRRRRG